MIEEKKGPITAAHTGQTSHRILGAYPHAKPSSGITEGESSTGETDNKLWTEAKKFRVEDNAATRELAFTLDPLSQIIAEIKEYSMLEGYTLQVVKEGTDKAGDTAALKVRINGYLKSIHMLDTFRETVPALVMHGHGALQKQMKEDHVTGLVFLKNLDRFPNPIDSSDFYYYQKLFIRKDWRSPESDQSEEQRVWYIDEEKKESFTEIKAGDIIFPRDSIIEIKNTKGGKANMSPILTYIFAKHFIITSLRKLIRLVTAPYHAMIYKTMDSNGNYIIPLKPTAAQEASDPAQAKIDLEDYDDWWASLIATSDDITSNREEDVETLYPDTLSEKVIESVQSMSPQMLETIMGILDTQISYGMGYSISLINGSGIELATTKEIYNTLAITLRGLQKQYEEIAQQLIEQEFPEAKEAGIILKLTELTPEDATADALRRKEYSAIVKNLEDVPFSSESLLDFIKKNIGHELELGARELAENPLDLGV